MRIAIYSRKSVWTGKGDSVENQVEMCRQYIWDRLPEGRTAEVMVYEDEGFSGKNMERPRLRQMLEDSRRTRIDCIICYRLDRISRSVSDFAPLVEDLMSRNIAFVCIREQFDTSTPMGKAMMYIASVFAQLERETIAERVRDNMVMLARSGRWLGGTPPTGFCSQQVEEAASNGRIRRFYRLAWDPGEIGTARLIYEEFLLQKSLSGVCRALRERGIHTRTGGDFSPVALKEILKNPVYCIADQDAREYFLGEGTDVCFDEGECDGKRGIAAYNKRASGQKGAPRQRREQWIVAVGGHRGIVTGKEWVAVQKALNGNQNGQSIRTNNGYALLSGMLRCGRCGRRMFAKARSNDPCRYDYICSAKLRGGRAACGGQNLSGPETDKQVFRGLTESLAGKRVPSAQIDKICRAAEREAKAASQAEIKSEINRCAQEIRRLVTALGQEDISQALRKHISRRVAQLDERIALLKAEAREADARAEEGEEAAEKVAESLLRWETAPPLLTIQERRELVRLMVREIRWEETSCRLTLYLRGEEPKAGLKGGLKDRTKDVGRSPGKA